MLAFMFSEDELIAICKEIGEIRASQEYLKDIVDEVERDVHASLDLLGVEIDALDNRLKNYTQVTV